MADGWTATDEIAPGYERNHGTGPTAGEWSVSIDKPAAEPASWRDALRLGQLGGNSFLFGMGNRLIAAERALTGKEGYSDTLKRLAAEDEATREKYPWTSKGVELAAGIGQGAALAGRGLIGAGQGLGLAGRAGVGALEGGALGALQGAGTTYSGIPADYVHNAGMGGILGAGIGAAAPVIGQVGGAAYRAAADRGFFGGIPRVLADAGQADAAGLRNLPNIPGAMLPDAGPSMVGTAQGARTGAGGPGKTALTDALTTRNTAQGQRITGDIDRTFGPAPVPSQIEAGIRDNMGNMGPLYEAALNNARAIDNTALARAIETQIVNTRGDAQAALRQVRSMLDIPTNPGHLDPHPRAMQATREAVRGMMAATDDPTTRGALENVYRQLTREMQAKIPGIRQLDAQYAELGTQQRALQPDSPGAAMFDTGRQSVQRPAELAATLEQAGRSKGEAIGPSAERFRMTQAARAELDRIVGTNRHDLAALERVLGQPQDYNAEKLAIMFGPERARALRAVMDRERTFANTYQDVVKGPQTADRLLAAKALDASEGKIPLDITLTGLATRGLQEAARAATKNASASNRERIAALMATQDPAELQRLVQQILAANPQRNATQSVVRNAIARAISGGTALAPSITNQ